MKTLVICWNVSRVPWFRTLQRAVSALDPDHVFDWIAVSRAEQYRLWLEGIRAPHLASAARQASRLSGTGAPDREALDPLIAYEASLSNAPPREALYRTAGQYVAWYDDYLAKERPDLILCINGWRLHTSAAVHAARQRSIPVLFVENGYLPFTTVVDPVGVNFAGSLTGMPLATSVDRQALEDLLDRYHRGALNRPASVPGWKEYVARGMSAASTLLPRPGSDISAEEMTFREAIETWRGEGKRRGGELDCGEISGSYVFFPMQVEDDSQLLIHSPWIQSMEQAIRLIAQHLPADAQLVVKRHPSDRGRTPLEGIRSLLLEHGGAFISSGSMNDLLRNARAVVTINSTVGFEALTWYRPVVVLGQAPYAGHGATIDVTGPDQLPGALRRALGVEPDEEMIDRVLYTALFHYLYPSGWKDPVPGEMKRIAELVVEQAGQ